mmetsp:Transcript_77015/g.198327  ORF Transcript_77015/g.198327 Transcript_77015/m.198327 type:complete len:394 (-) Transcript_77015:186-1367(-)
MFATCCAPEQVCADLCCEVDARPGVTGSRLTEVNDLRRGAAATLGVLGEEDFGGMLDVNVKVLSSSTPEPRLLVPDLYEAALAAAEHKKGLSRLRGQAPEADSDECSTPSTQGSLTPPAPGPGGGATGGDAAAEDRFGGTRRQRRRRSRPREARASPSPSPTPPPDGSSDEDGDDAVLSRSRRTLPLLHLHGLHGEAVALRRLDEGRPEGRPILLGRTGKTPAEMARLRHAAREAGAKPSEVTELRLKERSRGAAHCPARQKKDRRSATAKSSPVSDLFTIQEIDQAAYFHGGRAPRTSREDTDERMTQFLLVQGYMDVHSRKVIMDGSRCAFSYPLHGAVRSGDAEVVGLLLRENANSAAMDSEGLTPLQLAQQLDEAGSHRAVIEFFSSYA